MYELQLAVSHFLPILVITKLVDYELTQKHVENNNKETYHHPEKGGQTPELVPMLVQGHYLMIMRRRWKNCEN